MKDCPFCGADEGSFSYYEMVHPMYNNKGIEVGKIWFMRTACLSCGACGPWANDPDKDVAAKIADNSWDDRVCDGSEKV